MKNEIAKKFNTTECRLDSVHTHLHIVKRHLQVISKNKEEQVAEELKELESDAISLINKLDLFIDKYGLQLVE